MSEEEKKAIERIKKLLIVEKCDCEIHTKNKKAVETILNLIEKQQKLINIFIHNEAVRENKDFNEIKEKYYECL